MLLLWMPSTSCAAMAAASVGSSPRYSKSRPFHGTRAMLTAGPSITLAPLRRCSRPLARPYASARPGSKVIATAICDGSAVARVKPPQTPCGPSWLPMCGMPNCGSASIVPWYGFEWLADVRCITEARSIEATSASARARADGGHGTGAAEARRSTSSSNTATGTYAGGMFAVERHSDTTAFSTCLLTSPALALLRRLDVALSGTYSRDGGDVHVSKEKSQFEILRRRLRRT